MDEKWYPAVIVLAILGAMFYALHADLSRPLQPPAISAREQIGPPQTPPRENDKPAASDQRGTEPAPTASEQINADEARAEAERKRYEIYEKSFIERRLTSYTGWLAIATFVLSIVAAVQVCLFVWQLSLMRGGIQDAKIAAEAARDGAQAATDGAKASRESAEIARLTMISQDRAYIHHQSYRWISHFNSGTNKYFWRIHPIWINSGNTPPRNLFLFVQYEYGNTPLPKDFGFDVPVDVERTPSTIAPKGTIESSYYDITGDDLIGVRDGEMFLYVWGIARYRDVFPETASRITKFCHFVRTVTGDPLKGWHAETNPVEIVFGHYHQNNCTDEDCEET
jgi:hypothetical protein